MERDDLIVQKIRNLLDSNNIQYEYVEHEPTITSDDAAGMRDTKPEEGAKALILRTSKTRKNLMAILPGNLKIDSKKLKQLINNEDFAFEDPKVILDKFGLIIGGVPPFWEIVSGGYDQEGILPAFIDKRLLDNEQIAFNCGKRTCSIIMKTKDYMNVVKGNSVADFSKN